MSNQKNKGFSGKGYYIALILCAAAIGISGYLYYQNNPVDPQLQSPTIGVGSPNSDDIQAVATHPSPLAWRIPWTEEPGGLQRFGHG